MKISHFSIKRPLATMMIVIGLVFVGIVSLRGLPIDLFPELEYPGVSVQVPYPGAAPGTVETSITQTLEEALSGLEGVKKVSAWSSEGYSTIFVEFEWGTDLDVKAIDVREKVDALEPLFPEDAEDPVVLKASLMSAETVLLFAVSKKLTPDEKARSARDEAFRNDLAYLTRQFVQDEVKPVVERIPGMSSAYLSGGREREILVSVDMYKLKAKGVTLDDLETALDLENVEEPGGRLDERQTEVSTRFVGRYTSVSELGDIEVKQVNGRPVYVGDVATVEDTYKEQRSYARMNGADVILVDLVKESGENSAAIADEVYPLLEELREQFPDYEFAVTLDFTDFLRSSIQMVKDNAMIGGAIALLVLLLFLRSVRSVIIAGIAIPVAIIATFTLIKTANLTLNLLSLGGLALGVGMLVDNSIVMLENITRRIAISRDPIKGAQEGADEVGAAISASTYTTMAVFVPVIFFVSGIAGQIFDDLALTVAFALGCSLLVALLFVPMACSRLLKPDPRKAIDPKTNPEAVARSRLVRGLGRILPSILHRRSLAVITVVLILVGSVALLSTVGFSFFPEFDRGDFAIALDMPVDASLEASNAAARTLEQIVDEKTPSLKHYSVSVRPQSATLDVKLQDDRTMTTFDVRRRLREFINVIPGGSAFVAELGRGHGGGAAVEILVRGPTNVEVEPLRAVAEAVRTTAEDVPGAVNVQNDLKAGRREVQMTPNRFRIDDRRLTSDFIASTLRTYLTGKVVTTYREGDDEYDVRIKLKDAQNLSPDELRALLIPVPGTGTTVALEEVAGVEPGFGPVTLQRQDQARVAKVLVDVEEGAVLSEVVGAIKKKLDEQGLPGGYSYSIGGEEEERQEAMGQMTFALIVSIALVYMIMVAQFESLVFPFAIIQTVPLCIVGVALALFVTGQPVSLMVMLGLIMLAGIVVNNAIVLVDFINTLRHRGYERKEAVVLGAQVRFRPIVMTTLTTIGGMMPLALGLGSGSELYQAMAITVIGGLLVSTIFTVLYIPVTYMILDDLSVWTKKRFLALEHGIENRLRRLLKRGKAVAD